MDNYKIKVNDEAKSKEAQELFVQLGFEKTGFSCDEFPCYLATWGGGFSDYVLDSLSISRERKELTLPQLRDLVVLKRNDVKDANYRSKSVLDGFYFKSCDGVFYFMFEGKWVRSTTNTDEGLEPIAKDPALISGDVALANVHKCTVQYLHDDEPYGRWTTITDHFWSQYHLGMFLDPDTKFKFRFKPQTIKLELELPKPFEPKDNDWVWTISGVQEGGITQILHRDGNDYPLGAWRTEEEIKRVVEQLRKIRGTNS
ncbi:hypothetical protein ABTO55_08430 [Acinetobacter baumannii]